MSLSEIYQKFFKTKKIIRLKTSHPNEDYFDGIILKNHKQFLILLEENNFELDGIIILAKKFITGYRYGKYEKFLNKIIKFNNQYRKIRIPVWLNKCDTFEDILKSCMRKQIYTAIEILFKKTNKLESTFYFGSIKGGNQERCRLHYLSADGKWKDEYYIQFSEIFMIEINSKYSNNFNKFIKAQRNKNAKSKKGTDVLAH